MEGRLGSSDDGGRVGRVSWKGWWEVRLRSSGDGGKVGWVSSMDGGRAFRVNSVVGGRVGRVSRYGWWKGR